MSVVKFSLCLLATSLLIGCSEGADTAQTGSDVATSKINSPYAVHLPDYLIASNLAPASDPSNSAGWRLNANISDEFNGKEIDHAKWLVQGHEGNYYIWKGRAPSQFAPHNVIVGDGILKIRTQWEPDFPFAQEAYADGQNNDTYGVHEGQPLPVTTAAVVSKQRFLNGYMEVRSKAGYAAMTAAFWAIGYQQELDIYEQMGNPTIKGGLAGNKTKMTVHDWSPPAIRPTRVFGYSQELPYNVSEEYGVFGAEWGQDYLKLFIDGKEVYHVQQKDIGTDFVLNNPMEIWLDSEIFKWLGVPNEAELPVNYEIDYVRVWQKPSENILDQQRQFFGFEGPYIFQDQQRPFDLLPEDSDNNDYQQFWRMNKAGKEKLQIVENRWLTGVNSLKYITKGDPVDLTATSPRGSIELEPGEYELSFKAFLNNGLQPSRMSMDLQSPKVELSFDLDAVERDKWVTVKKRFTKTQASTANDHLIIEILGENIPKGSRDFYIDDIEIKSIK